MGRTIAILATSFLLTGPAAADVTITYTYDTLGRLISSAETGNASTTYIYDAADNRTSTTVSGASATAQISIAPISANEGNDLVFAVTRAGDTTRAQSVDFETSDGTATAGADYTATSGTIIFEAGETDKTITVATTDDYDVEGDQAFNVTLSEPTNGAEITTGTADGTIVDNDRAAQFAVSGGSIEEGGDITFTVTRSGDTSIAHAVSYTTVDGTATVVDSDYVAASDVLVFGVGVTSLDVIANTTGDDDIEPDEAFSLLLSNPTNGATITTSSANGTILNNDVLANFVLSTVTVDEGDDVVAVVTRSGDLSVTHTVNYLTESGTATEGTDYTGVSGTLTFDPDVIQQQFVVTTTPDHGVEGDEAFNIKLENATSGAVIDTPSVGFVITDDDRAADFTVSDAIGAEGQTLTFTVARNGDRSITHAVDYQTADGTATTPADYPAVAGTLTFLVDEIEKTVIVDLVADGTPEADRAALHLGYARFWAGNFTETANGAGTDGDAQFAYAQFTVRF